MPPVCSLPQVMAPQLPFMRQSNTTMFCDGTLMRRPSASRPDLIATLSSWAPRLESRITTWSHDSGSTASVLLCAVLASVLTLSIVTFLHSVGWICQNIEFRSVMPWISTVSQLYGSMKVERMSWPEPGTTRSCGGFETCVSSQARSLPLFQDDVEAASSVPVPVRAMFVCP